MDLADTPVRGRLHRRRAGAYGGDAAYCGQPADVFSDEVWDDPPQGQVRCARCVHLHEQWRRAEEQFRLRGAEMQTRAARMSLLAAYGLNLYVVVADDGHLLAMYCHRDNALDAAVEYRNRGVSCAVINYVCDFPDMRLTRSVRGGGRPVAGVPLARLHVQPPDESDTRRVRIASERQLHVEEECDTDTWCCPGAGEPCGHENGPDDDACRRCGLERERVEAAAPERRGGAEWAST